MFLNTIGAALVGETQAVADSRHEGVRQCSVLAQLGTSDHAPVIAEIL